MRFFCGLLLGALLLGGALSPAWAQGRKEIWKPPIVVSTNVKVWRGESTNIALRGFQANNPVEYSIDRGPQHGTLSPIRQPNPDRVAASTDGFVVYTHNDEEGHNSDLFTFRARAVRGGGLSAPGTVSIEVMDRPAVLGAPRQLDFQAFAGEIDVRELSLTNSGGSPLQGRLQVQPPFQIEGDGIFHLLRQATTNIIIAYAPEKAGRADRQDLRLSTVPPTGGNVVLLGESASPFTVRPETAQMEVVDQARQVALRVQNFSDFPQSISVELPDQLPWEAPETIVLNPATFEDITLRIPAEGKGPGQEVRAVFRTDFHREEVTLTAPPIVAELAVETTELDFRESRQEALVVRNSGGVPGSFTLQPAEGLKFSTGGLLDARTFQVPPGGKKKVVLLLDVRRGTPPPESLIVELPGGELADVSILTREEEATPIPPLEPVVPPPPPEHPWALNVDILLASSEEDEATLQWRSDQSGWRDPQLEVQREGIFVRYEAPAEERGFFQRIGDYFRGFFKPIAEPEERRKINTIGWEDEPPPEWIEETIAGINADDLWRLTARQLANGQRLAVTVPFRIAADQGTLVPAEPARPAAAEKPPAEQTATTPMPTPPPVSRPLAHTIEPVLKIEDARMSAERHAVTLRLVVAHDPDVDGYRLERGATQWQVDPETNIPHSPKFVPLDGPGRWQILGVGSLTHEERDLSVIVARIEDLPAGSSTIWRLVPTANGEDRLPSAEFTVPTLPPWRMPWRTIGLIAASLALVFLLYLRHRARQPRDGMRL